MSSTSSGLHTSSTFVRGLRARDPEAWERLLRLYGPSVLALTRRAGLDEDRAADVFQEVFEAVDRHFPRFRHGRRRGSFRAWLRTITRNKIHDLYRADAREPPAVGGTAAWRKLDAIEDPDALPADDATSVQESEACSESGGNDQEPSVQDGDDSRLLRRALDLLREQFEEKTFRAFWETAVEGRSPTDVAADLESTPGAVRVAKCRVLKRLRDLLGEPPGPGEP